MSVLPEPGHKWEASVEKYNRFACSPASQERGKCQKCTDMEELEAQGTILLGSSAGQVTQLIPVQDWAQGGAGCLQDSEQRAGSTATCQQPQYGSRQREAGRGTENYPGNSLV